MLATSRSPAEHGLNSMNSGGSPALRWEDRRQHVDRLIEAALAAVDPSEAVRRHLSLRGDKLQIGRHLVPLPGDGRVLLVGAGKAGVAMATACQSILGARLAAGVMAVPQLPSADKGPIEWICGGHPVPDEGSLKAGRAVRSLLADAGEGDLVLGLISGGGSALLELPAEGITLMDLKTTTELLLKSGANIHEVNSIRHQLSLVKGGGIARMASPARLAVMVLSDVVGDRLDIIASGPTVPPQTKPEQAVSLIHKLGLVNRLPPLVWAHLQARVDTPSAETPAALHVIIGNNHMAALAARNRASDLGFHSLLLTSNLEGEASQAGKLLAAFAKSVRRHRDPVDPPACLVFGGETTVTVRGAGTGGRNQELALAAALALEGWDACLVATLATDGVDGLTSAAGALVDGTTAQEGRRDGLDPSQHLAANNSHPFLANLNATIELGPTGTNVNDLAFVIVYE